MKNRQVAAVAMGMAMLCGSGARGDHPVERNPKLTAMEPNRWLLLHEQAPGDAVRFRRQPHGGSCFDARRGELILFGSDTHGKDWKNSPFIFNVAKAEWTQVYAEDPKETYAVTPEGLPVAGVNGDHPWAMHTFGAVVHDARRDEMVVVSYPAHMRPDKWGQSLKHLWPGIKKHPNWVFDLAARTWAPLPGEPRHFFPHCAAMDTDRGILIGCRGGRISELSGEPRTWRDVPSKAHFGWHDNCVYDSKHKALVIFGSNQNANDILVYHTETGEQRLMPTPGTRPPKDQHNPMAFVPEIGQTVVLVDRTRRKDNAESDTTETWRYDLAADAWTRIETATLPFACGMNYNMEYDPNNNVCLLVAQVPERSGRVTGVYALKISPITQSL